MKKIGTKLTAVSVSCIAFTVLVTVIVMNICSNNLINSIIKTDTERAAALMETMTSDF